MTAEGFAHGLHRILSRSSRIPRTKSQILVFAQASGMLPRCAEIGFELLVARGDLVANVLGEFELRDGGR